MSGYQDDFLDGIHLPLPSFSFEIEDEILQKQTTLRDGHIADYVNYSLVMNQHINKRSPVFVALNIDQRKFKDTQRSNRWKIDSRIGFEHQLDNDYYRSNPWDRGHMARRTTTAWGYTQRDAQLASDETFYYSNSCLQHENLNQDEWLGLEDWVYALDLTDDNKITVYSGPFYADFDRTIRPEGRDLALIPSGFFKVVCFKNKNTKALDVRAFVMYQDAEALRDKNGRRRYNNQTYQSTVTEIEKLTKLTFDNRIYHANPLYYSMENVSAAENVTITPERYEIRNGAEIINGGDKRQTIKDDIVDVFIAAAMVNPQGNDQGKEWVSLINMGANSIDLKGWCLKDNSNKTLVIGSVIQNTQLHSGESIVITPLEPLKLSNSSDVIKLFDQEGARIDWVNYTPHMVVPGVPVAFLSPRDTLDHN